jgi:hypothetical protein
VAEEDAEFLRRSEIAVKALAGVVQAIHRELGAGGSGELPGQRRKRIRACG